MNTVGLVMVLSLSPIVAYSGLLNAPSGAGQPLLEMPATSSIAAAPPSHDAPAGLIAFDASSGDSAPASIGNDDSLGSDLAEYVFLHKTSNENLSASTASGLGIPWRWLRIYAVTPRPTENR